MNKSYKITAEELKKLRVDKLLTQQEVADGVNRTRNTIATWEKEGNEVNKLEDLVAICSFFEIPLPGLPVQNPSLPATTYEKATPLTKAESLEQRKLFALNKYKHKVDEVPFTDLMAEILRRLDELESKK